MSKISDATMNSTRLRRGSRSPVVTSKSLCFVLLTALVCALLFAFSPRLAPMPSQRTTTKERAIVNNQPSDPNDDKGNGIVYYSVARTDRSGATLIDMLLAHANTFNIGGKYGGACRGREPTRWTEKHEKAMSLEDGDRQKLRIYGQLGILDILPYGVPCPSKHETSTNYKVVLYDTKQFKPEKALQGDLGKLLSKEWVSFVRSQISLPNIQEKDPKVKTVALHMRRGDVSPCTQHYDKYIPNKFYLELLEKLTQDYKGYRLQVTVYTESDSAEDLSVFEKNGHTVFTEDDLAQVWRNMMVADVLVMSRSTFSIVPAILNVANDSRIIYPIFKWIPLDGWEFAPDDLLRKITGETKRLQKVLCPDRTLKRAFEFDPDINEHYRKYLAEKQ